VNQISRLVAHKLEGKHCELCAECGYDVFQIATDARAIMGTALCAWCNAAFPDETYCDGHGTWQRSDHLQLFRLGQPIQFRIYHVSVAPR